MQTDMIGCMNHHVSRNKSTNEVILTKVSKWDVLEFERLTSAALYSILAARMAVFVVEQDCPYQDADGLDDASLHVCGWSTGEKLLAYARITPPGSRFDEPAIGRVLTLLDR